MRTTQLYYQEPYKTSLDATVLSVEQKGTLFNVILDKTIFYPEGGGQPSDKGMISSAKIEYVRTIDGEIVHQVKGALVVGSSVGCVLDWNWRYKHMKIHTAGHLIHDVLTTKVTDLVPVQGSHGKKAYIEYLGTYDVAHKEELEAEVNAILQKDLPVVTRESTYEELEKSCKLLPPNLPKNKPLRMIQIGDYSPMPDGGVHVKSTKEIGKIWIANIINANGKTTIRYGVLGID